VVQTPPYLKIREQKHEEEVIESSVNDQYEGYCADLAKAIAKKMDIPFNYELRPVKDGMYGAKQDNGTWNGMIGELSRRVPLTNSY